MTDCSGDTLLATINQSSESFSLYSTKKCNIGQPPSGHEGNSKVTYVELTSKIVSLSGILGAAPIVY